MWTKKRPTKVGWYFVRTTVDPGAGCWSPNVPVNERDAEIVHLVPSGELCSMYGTIGEDDIEYWGPRVEFPAPPTYKSGRNQAFDQTVAYLEGLRAVYAGTLDIRAQRVAEHLIEKVQGWKEDEAYTA